MRDEPIVARPVGSLERAWRWCKRNRGLAIGMGAAALGLLVAFLLAIAFGVREKWHSANLEKEQDNTSAALVLAEGNLRQSHRESSQLALTQGLRLCDEESEGHKGLLWLVRALDFASRARTRTWNAPSATTSANGRASCRDWLTACPTRIRSRSGGQP